MQTQRLLCFCKSSIVIRPKKGIGESAVLDDISLLQLSISFDPLIK